MPELAGGKPGDGRKARTGEHVAGLGPTRGRLSRRPPPGLGHRHTGRHACRAPDRAFRHAGRRSRCRTARSVPTACLAPDAEASTPTPINLRLPIERFGTWDVVPGAEPLAESVRVVPVSGPRPGTGLVRVTTDPQHVCFLQRVPWTMLDLLSRLVTDLRLQVQVPRTHVFGGEWAVLVPSGPPSLHLLLRGSCRASSAESRHPLPIAAGSALLLSGAQDCKIQACGPERPATSELDWDGGTPLEQRVSLPEDPSAVLMLSARIKMHPRPGRSIPLPAVWALDPERIWSNGRRESVLGSLNAELSYPRLGISAITVRLIETFLIQGLRSDLRIGFWRAPGWLGALTDPVLRTGLIDAETESALASVRALSADVHRSPSRIRARVRAFSGAPPGRLLRQLRMERALRRLEQDELTLENLAHELGYSGVSTFCRAFRREMGCTPAEYWRRSRGRPFPRRPRHPSIRGASDDAEPTPLDSAPTGE